jgi:hypothetical protein
MQVRAGSIPAQGTLQYFNPLDPCGLQGFFISGCGVGCGVDILYPNPESNPVNFPVIGSIHFVFKTLNFLVFN